MNTYKAKTIISKMLKYYDGDDDFLNDEQKLYIRAANSGLEYAVNAFINAFSGNKKAKLKAYADSVINSKRGV